MCSSQPDCLDVVWNICVVPTPEEDRQGRDRGWGMGEGRSGGTPGLLRKKPSVFPSLLSPPPQCGVTSERSQGTAWGRCKMWVCGRGREREKKMERKHDRDKATVWWTVRSGWWLMKLKVRVLAIHRTAGRVGERGDERSLGPNLWLASPPAAAPQPSSLPICVWCLFTSLFNHGAVPVVDWHKMTAA